MAGAMAVVAIIGAVAIGRGAPMLWDEAVYSLRVRDAVGAGVSGSYWLEVRAPGLPFMLAGVVLLTGADGFLATGDATALRAVCLAIAVTGVGLTWLLARLLAGAAAAVIAAWILAITPGWNESSWQVMPDIPGAVLTVAAMVVILLAARGGRLSWWAVLAAPLAGVATLTRYGAPLTIGPAILAALLLRWEAVRSSTLRAAVVLLSTAAAAGIVWFVPAVTGVSRAPVLIFLGRQDDKAIPALTSAADFAVTFAEALGPIVVVLVLVGGGAALAPRWQRPGLRWPALACAAIAGIALLLMLVGIAEYNVRYFAPALPFLAIVAAIGLAGLVGSRPTRAVVAVAAVTTVVGLGLAASTALDRTRELYDRFATVRDAYGVITREVRPPCVVLDNNPTAEWYTGCAAFGAAELPAPGAPWRGGLIGVDEPVFAVVRDYPNRGNPSDAMRAVLDDVAVGVTEVGDVTVLELGTAGEYAAALERRGVSL